MLGDDSKGIFQLLTGVNSPFGALCAEDVNDVNDILHLDDEISVLVTKYNVTSAGALNGNGSGSGVASSPPAAQPPSLQLQSSRFAAPPAAVIFGGGAGAAAASAGNNVLSGGKYSPVVAPQVGFRTGAGVISSPPEASKRRVGATAPHTQPAYGGAFAAPRPLQHINPSVAARARNVANNAAGAQQQNGGRGAVGGASVAPGIFHFTVRPAIPNAKALCSNGAAKAPPPMVKVLGRTYAVCVTANAGARHAPHVQVAAGN